MKFIEKIIKSDDNTLITYYMTAAGDSDKKILIANGLGGSFSIWKHFIQFFPNYQFISWDYRGLYRSQKPNNLSDLSIEHHIGDLNKIIETEKIDKFIFMGWSLGVQIALQFYNKYPEKVEKLILISGPYKNFLNNLAPLNLLKDIPFVDYLFKKLQIDKELPIPWLKVIDIIEKYHKIYSKLLKLSAKIPSVVPILKKLHFVNENMPEKFFNSIIKEYSELNMEIMMEVVKFIHKDNSEDILEKIDIPTLLIGGSSDIFTPIKWMKKMGKKIKNSDFLEIYRGSHYSFLEFSDLVNYKVKKFLKED